MSEQDLGGKVVLVTGAARRIGAAIVTRLHENGARVAIHYRSSPPPTRPRLLRLTCSK